jgi:hypothetical protein
LIGDNKNWGIVVMSISECGMWNADISSLGSLGFMATKKEESTIWYPKRNRSIIALKNNSIGKMES